VENPGKAKKKEVLRRKQARNAVSHAVSIHKTTHQSKSYKKTPGAKEVKPRGKTNIRRINTNASHGSDQ
jgi:hypothetical protein